MLKTFEENQNTLKSQQIKSPQNIELTSTNQNNNTKDKDDTNSLATQVFVNNNNENDQNIIMGISQITSNLNNQNNPLKNESNTNNNLPKNINENCDSNSLTNNNKLGNIFTNEMNIFNKQGIDTSENLILKNNTFFTNIFHNEQYNNSNNNVFGLFQDNQKSSLFKHPTPINTDNSNQYQTNTLKTITLPITETEPKKSNNIQLDICSIFNKLPTQQNVSKFI